MIKYRLRGSWVHFSGVLIQDDSKVQFVADISTGSGANIEDGQEAHLRAKDIKASN